MEALAAVPRAAVRQRAGSRRAMAVLWLRKAHGWVGLWGASLGLLFGVSGIWLNHRAVLKLPPVAQQRSDSHLALPDPAPVNAQALATWLQAALQLRAVATSVKSEPARPVAWSEGVGHAGGQGAPVLMQPAHWTVTFGGPQSSIQAEFWVGNRSVGLRRIDNGPLATLTALHKGTGMTVPWILLVDTLSGSLILLTLSGVILWMLTHSRRRLGTAVFAGALFLALGFAMA
jgi:hypothetical protein